MPATSQSPNTGNYFVGKGNLFFTPVGGVRRHLGNAPSITFTPAVETLEHFSSMGGVRTKDFDIITSRQGTLAMTLEEYTPDNLAMAVLGDVDYDDPDGPSIEIFSKSEVRGMLELEGTNDIGARINAVWHNVQITPTSEVGFITDELGQIELEGSVQPAQGGPNNGKFGKITFVNLVEETEPSAITSLNPNTGGTAGGTATVITGTGFTGATGVTFGGTAGTGFNVINDTTINVTTPAHAAGQVAVVVTDADGNGTLNNGFTYA